MEQERKPRPFIVRVLADLVRRYFQDHVGRSAAELSYWAWCYPRRWPIF